MMYILMEGIFLLVHINILKVMIYSKRRNDATVCKYVSGIPEGSGYARDAPLQATSHRFRPGLAAHGCRWYQGVCLLLGGMTEKAHRFRWPVSGICPDWGNDS